MYDVEINDVFNEFDTFALLYEFEFDDTFKKPLSQYKIRSQIRDRYENLIDTPILEITDKDGILLTASKQLPESDALYVDLEFTLDNFVIHTDIYGFKLRSVVTKPDGWVN